MNTNPILTPHCPLTFISPFSMLKSIQPFFKATAKCTPPLCVRNSGQLMINRLPDRNLDMVTPTFSLSRNDHYVISTSGKIISLYNILTFKKMKSLMPSPPVCTCIIFYPPDNNILIFRMGDSSILIYNIHEDEFFFSVSANGEIKAWLFDNEGSRKTVAAPGSACMRMAFSTDRKRFRAKMVNLTRDLTYLILQFLVEENLKKTAHMLEKETGLFFDLIYFEALLLDGKWDEAEDYLSGFTQVQDDDYSTKIYFEMRKQKYLEALDKREHGLAIDILRKDLKVFAAENKELYVEMAQLLTLDDIREHPSLTSRGDELSTRIRMIREVKMIIVAHPRLKEKVMFPQVSESRLRRLINQSLNWQHLHCVWPLPNPRIRSLFKDHTCPGPDIMLGQLSNEDSLL